MKLFGLLCFALASVAGAQTPLSPLWTRPAFNNTLDVDTNLPTSRSLVLTAQELTVFPLHGSTPLWHARTHGEPSAEFSPDGSLIVLSGRDSRPRVYDAATGAFLRYLSSNANTLGRTLFVPATATSPNLPAGAEIFVEYHGFYRVSDGVQVLSSPYQQLDEQSTFSPDGGLLTGNASIRDLNPDSTWQGSGGNVFLAVTANSSGFVTTNQSDDRAVVVSIPDFQTTEEIPFPVGFLGLRIRRLGNSSRFAILGYETINGVNVASIIVIDIATGTVLDRRRTAFPIDGNPNDQYGHQNIVDEGDLGYAFVNNALDGMDRDRLLEVALDGAGHSTGATVLVDSPRAQEFLSGGFNGAGLLATGSTGSSAFIELLNGDTGIFSRKILRRPQPSGTFNCFTISPSGKYLFFNGLTGTTDGTTRMTAAAIPGGGITNESDAYAPYTLFPLADDTLLGYASTPDGVVNARMTRTGTTFKTYRIYPEDAGNPIVGASADGKTFLIADYADLRLYDNTTGKQTAYTVWDPVGMSEEEIQAVVEGDGFVVVAKRVTDETAKRIYLDIRRYARQGTVLVPLGTAVRRSYVLHKNVNGVDTGFGLHFRLSPDGRAVWANYQQTYGTDKSDWLGEWIRTADGAVLGQANDPGFDYGVTATAVDPLNRRGYLSRQDGALQGVPLTNAFASILSDAPEVVGGLPSGATFRLLRSAEVGAGYTAVATGVTLDHNDVNFDPGVRDVRIPFSVDPVDSAQDATIKVTDSFGTVSTKVHIVPPHLVSGAFLLPTITGGDSIDLDLTLDGPAASAGRTITLSDNSSSLLTPVSVVVPAGSNTVRLNVASKVVKKATAVTLTARLDGKAVTAKVTLNP